MPYFVAVMQGSQVLAKQVYSVDIPFTGGARRVSVGGSLARCAWSGFLRAAKQIATEGRFDAFAEAPPHADINGFFRDYLERRTSAAEDA